MASFGYVVQLFSQVYVYKISLNVPSNVTKVYQNICTQNEGGKQITNLKYAQ